MTKRHPRAGVLVALTTTLVAGACSGLQPPARATPDPGATAALNRLAPHRCTGTTASTLAGARIPTARVQSINYVAHLDGYSERVLGYSAWVRLTDQPGFVVVSLDANCAPRQIYTRGGAHVPSLAQW
ncbi:hypothetical protein [Azospirillum sp. ST 5-10]|uniref:hypothetical protein n=1 Tax=unclassified Azospirillum TaxID=2630922 RepID=UPI003F49D512